MVFFDDMIQYLGILSCRLFLFCQTFWATNYVQGDMNEALDGQGFSFLCAEPTLITTKHQIQRRFAQVEWT